MIRELSLLDLIRSRCFLSLASVLSLCCVSICYRQHVCGFQFPKSTCRVALGDMHLRIYSIAVPRPFGPEQGRLSWRILESCSNRYVGLSHLRILILDGTPCPKCERLIALLTAIFDRGLKLNLTGERLSPWVALGCVVMAFSLLFGN